VIVAIVGLTLAQVIGFLKVFRFLVRLEFKVDLLWNEWIDRRNSARRGGRRRSDVAADDSSPAA
jgi:hypothetical protein